MVIVKWTTEDWNLAFLEAKRLLDTGVEYGWGQLFLEVQKVLPTEKQRPNPVSSSTSWIFSKKYNAWKNGEPIEASPKKTGKGSRVFWDQDETDTVFAKADELGKQHPNWSSTKLLKKAQLVLPIKRHRPEKGLQRLITTYHKQGKSLRPDALLVQTHIQAKMAGKFNFCPNCGTANKGFNFCPNCGHSLK